MFPWNTFKPKGGRNISIVGIACALGFEGGKNMKLEVFHDIVLNGVRKDEMRV